MPAEALLSEIVAAAQPASQSPGGWPVLDPAALHGFVGEAVDVIGPHTEGDPAGIAVSLLVQFGAYVGAAPYFLADGARHPARLFAAIVGETSSGRKGTVVGQAERISSAADPKFARERRSNGYGSGEKLVDEIRGAEENTDHRLLLVEPEFARFLGVASRDGSTLSAIAREGWDGGTLAARSRAYTTVVSDAHLSILAMITPDELRARLSSTECANGFANRFLYVAVRRSKLLPSGGNLDDGDLAPFVRKFALFATEARKLGRLFRTPAAETLWAELYYEMAGDEPGGLLGAVIARAPAQVLRLSVAYALLDGAKRIDVQHVRAAYALWRYCRDSAGYIFGESIGDPAADTLLHAVRQAGRAGLDGRQRSALFAGHASRRQLDAAIALLITKGLVVVETIETGGRPSVILRASECEQSEQRRLLGMSLSRGHASATAMACEQSEQSEQSPDRSEQVATKGPQTADDFYSTDAADRYLDSFAGED